jgi:carbonic anhydrase
MSVIDEVLLANENYAARFGLGNLPMPPARKLAIVACTDARLTVEQALGLKTGEAHIIAMREASPPTTPSARSSFPITCWAPSSS